MFDKFDKLANFILESLLIKEDEDESLNNPHELMTACLCLYKNIKKIELYDEDDANNLIEALVDIANNKQLIIGANDKQIKEMQYHQKRYSSLAQAISAAKKIIEENGRFPERVMLTGNIQPDEIKKYFGIENLDKFGINSYKMKDFNSSDIVLLYKNRYVGVSLKQKERETTKDPTMTNVSLRNFLTPDEQEEINGYFDLFIAQTISKHANEIFSEKEVQKHMYAAYVNNTKSFIKNVPIGENLSFTEFKKAYLEKLMDVNFLKENSKWKKIISNTSGAEKNGSIFFRVKNGPATKDYIREIINAEMKRPKISVLTNINKIILRKKEEIGKDFLHQVFKDSLEKLSSHKFDFELCVGIGNKQKKGFFIGDAEFFKLADINSKLDELADNRDSGRLESDEIHNKFTTYKEEDGDIQFTAATLFYDLKFGNEVVAHVEVRFKGTFTQPPNFLAFFDENFKKKLKYE